MKPAERNTSRKTIAWCKRCSREHARQDECNLVLAERIAKSGRKVYRMVHADMVKG